MPISSFLRKVVINTAEENSVIGHYSHTEDIERGNQLGDSLRPDLSANLRRLASDENEAGTFVAP